ncbi:prenyltransferase/squalene oxidase repeat-containing protein [Pseudomonas sp. NPDC078700]|uniref:prenyltransferase/squalene oxidase repeat-containing protein n=1 Tax=Pseudomonas sp. NPDC078700 TaxID=3364424 RepID=UPI0037C53028
MSKNKLIIALCVSTSILSFMGSAQAVAAESWNKTKATEWLDKRAQAWLNFPYAREKSKMEGHRSASCIACHTTSNYTVTRPHLEKSGGSADQVLDNIRRRIIAGQSAEPWDVEPAGRVTESYGSEGILNAYTLALSDEANGLKKTSPLAVSAFERLWHHQKANGGWDTFDFKLEPYATLEARPVLASMAAIAVGRAPGYLEMEKNDGTIKAHIKSLRDYLTTTRNPENLWSETWLLQASLTLDGLLTREEKNAVIKKLIAKQAKSGDDKGSWALFSLNDWTYDGVKPRKEARKLSPGAKGPDGLATGLIAYTLMRSGMKPTDQPVADALDWLRRNQQPDGSWVKLSINKVRDPSSQPYYFMSDEATVWSVRALMASEGWPY